MRMIVLPALVALTACQGDPVTSSEQAQSDAATARQTPGAPATRPTPPPIDAARLGYERVPVTLMSDGIILVGAVDGIGTATTLTFGQDRKLVLDAMGEAFPRPDLTRNEECGAGPMDFARYGKLTLNFSEGKFDGWSARHADNLSTVDGVKVGESFAKIARKRAARRIADSTLEGEFHMTSSDGQPIFGFLSGEGSAAKVESLYAGANCFFR